MNIVESNRIIVHYGEIGLKGKNQPAFRKQLARNIARKLSVSGLDWPVEETRGYLKICVPPHSARELDHVRDLLQEVSGVVWYAPAVEFSRGELELGAPNPDLSRLEAVISEYAGERFSPGESFCVRVKRVDKRFPISSGTLERRFGAAIIQNTDWQQVNLSTPDITFQVTIYPGKVFLYSRKWRGMGGLPVGTVGRVLALLSGGIDSPVAAYLAARRGCQVDFIHFAATMMQQQEAEAYKITRIVKHLSRFTFHSRLYLVPYIHFDMAMFGAHSEYELILFRRFMARVAESLASRTRAEALLTGDNLAQVASQTMPNMVSTSRAVALPILRPLLTYDKQEIVDLARRIGTYELSIEPYKDCCAIISRHPKTRSDSRVLIGIEEETFGAEYQKLIDKTLSDAVCLEFELGKQVQNS